MKRIFLLGAVMLALVVGIGNVNGQEKKLIPIRNGVETMPMRVEKSANNGEVCWQVVYDPGRDLLRKQIFPVNGADKSAITQEMLDSLKALNPQVTEDNVFEWKSFGFTCRPAGWTGDEKKAEPVEKTTTPVATPLPKVEQQQVAKPAEVVATPAVAPPEVKKAEATKPVPAKPPVAVSQKTPRVSLLAECRAKVAELESKEESSEKTLGEYLAKLKTAKEDLKAAREINIEALKELKDVKEALKKYSPGRRVWTYLCIIFIGALLGALLLSLFLWRRKKAAGKTPTP